MVTTSRDRTGEPKVYLLPDPTGAAPFLSNPAVQNPEPFRLDSALSALLQLSPASVVSTPSAVRDCFRQGSAVQGRVGS